MPVPTEGPQRSPAQMSLSELQDDVATYSRAGNEDEPRAICLRAINSAIRMVNRRHWYWSATFSEITMVAGTADYVLPATFDGVVPPIELLDPGGASRSMLEYLDPETFGRWFPSDAAGDPRCATVYSAEDLLQLTLNCLPSATWAASYPTIRVRHLSAVPLLVNPDDRLVGIPTPWQEYINWYAKFTACAVFDPDGNRIAIAKMEKDRLWEELRAKDSSYHCL